MITKVHQLIAWIVMFASLVGDFVYVILQKYVYFLSAKTSCYPFQIL